MAKFNSKLSPKEVEELFYKLSVAISKVKSTRDAADFLRDLLSYQEAEMIAKRLKIAELLLDNKTYEEINQELRVSYGTIARVQEWLKLQGDGYRKAVKNTKGKTTAAKEERDMSSWNSIKKRYPQYYWPELLLENIIINANNKQKREIKSVIGQMEKMKEKSALFKRIRKISRYQPARR